MEGLTQFCDDAEVVSNCTLRVVSVASNSTESAISKGKELELQVELRLYFLASFRRVNRV